ncbi:hypothetical protein [Planctobacterium marinum]|uniref:hypothetical protein n=1 Tax=Planctobacterium marinum TaxID=1631968 RepID=UPI0030C7451B
MIELIIVFVLITVWLSRFKNVSEFIQTLICCFLLGVVSLRMLRMATRSLLNRRCN